MNRFYIIISLLLLCTASASAQQEPLHTNFMYNKIAYNPGFAGSDPARLTALYRNQWMGFEGAPTTMSVSYTGRTFGDRVGLGINLTRTEISISRMLTGELSYAYRVPVYDGQLALGVQFNMRHLYQNWADPRIITSQTGIDNGIPTDARSKLVVNFGCGLYYHTFNWYVGLGLPRIKDNNIDFVDVSGELSREVPHLNLMGGYTFRIDEDFLVTAQSIFRYVPHTPIDADFNATARLQNKFYAGLTYRLGGETGSIGESFAVLGGVNMKENLYFGLAYDITLTRLRRYSNGSVEAVVYWQFGKEQIDPKKVLPANRPWERRATPTKNTPGKNSKPTPKKKKN